MILEFQRIILLSVDLSKYIAYVIMQTDKDRKKGCTHNSCKFCTMYRDVDFRLQPMEWIE